MQLSLASRINLVIGALTALTTIVLGVGLFNVLSELKERALVQRGAEIAEIIGDSSRRASYTGSREEAQAALAELAARPNVAYARILAADGTTLAARVVQKEMALASLHGVLGSPERRPLSRSARADSQRHAWRPGQLVGRAAPGHPATARRPLAMLDAIVAEDGTP